MKQSLITMMLAAAMFAPGAFAQHIEARKDAQQARIRRGVRSGELNFREATRLEAQEHALNRQIRRDRLDGAGLSQRERARIERQQNQLSRRIAVQKHDRQHR